MNRIQRSRRQFLSGVAAIAGNLFLCFRCGANVPSRELDSAPAPSNAGSSLTTFNHVASEMSYFGPDVGASMVFTYDRQDRVVGVGVGT